MVSLFFGPKNRKRGNPEYADGTGFVAIAMTIFDNLLRMAYLSRQEREGQIIDGAIRFFFQAWAISPDTRAHSLHGNRAAPAISQL